MISLKSNGKLLISGEYTVLDGSLAFALPTKFGQKMTVEFDKNSSDSTINWQAFNSENESWFECIFNYHNFEIIFTSNQLFSETLIGIFKSIKELKSDFFLKSHNYIFNSYLEFLNNWGLGSSSTLIANLSTFFEVNEYDLLKKTFGGSGYDLACAKNNTPIFYQIQNEKRLITPIKFNPIFKENIYFLHLNQKQNSREGIKKYKSFPKNETLINEISAISKELIYTNSIDDFAKLLIKHENLISDFLQIPRIQTIYFNDFNGTIKSLGAWGGDFVMVVSNENPTNYFNKKGFETLLTYDEMIL